MSRFGRGGSYDQRIRKADWGGGYVISWTYDTYISGSRLRFPQTRSRETDHAGAVRFAKKWDLRHEFNAADIKI